MSKENFFLKSLRTQIPAMLCLEHLHSEYSSLKSDKKIDIGDEDEEFIKKLFDNRETTPPTWHDLYRFELVLANHIPIGKLRGKVVRLRYDYRNVAGQKEFDDYMASKPPDMQSPPNPEDPPDKHTNFEKLVRDDLKDLLDRLYLRYAILPIKEKKLNKLTFIAAGLCLASLLVLLGIVVWLFAYSDRLKIGSLSDSKDIGSLTILVVVVTGAMGGFVSALQRIQRQPADGDSIYNLSILFYGSYSVFVAPITGAIFAILLYLMFTSQVLTGIFFPRIYTPPALETTVTKESTTNPKNSSGEPPAPQIAETHTTESNTANTPSSAAGGNSEVAGTETKINRNVNANTNVSPSPTSTPKPTPEPVPEKSLKVLEFLAESGPAGGKDYALLILWCFIAGFAERFVPDALDRFIKRGNAGNGGKI